MFIQCQHCHTTYKIEEDKLPHKEAMVRCAKCSEPIPLNKEKQVELLKQSPKRIISCDECGTQYSVAETLFNKSSTKVKCGNCGNMFPISPATDDSEESPVDSSAKDYEDEEIDLDNIDIPEESEIEVDDLFENLDEEPVSDAEEAEEELEEQEPKDAEQEYLESIKLSDDDVEDELDEDIGIDEISDDQKYKIFLKPKTKEDQDDSLDEVPSWPEIEEDPNEAVTAAGDLDSFTDLDDISDLPDLEEEAISEETKKHSPKRSPFFWLLWLLIVIFAIVVGWMVLVPDQHPNTPSQTEAFDKQQSKVAILEPLSYKILHNKILNQRMFVLEGKLLNIYEEENLLSRIEVEGFLYTNDRKKPFRAISYAGTTLSEKQFQTLTKAQITDLLTEQSKNSGAILEFGTDDLIEFQVVFFDAPSPKSINKLGAKIKKFNRRTL